MAAGRSKLTVGSNIKVAVKTPAAHNFVSRGFYQVEEDSLYVPIHPAGRFYSFLDSSQMVFDIGAKGRLLFIQVLIPRRGWITRDDIKPPSGLATADISFLGFRDRLPVARLETASDHSWARLVFADSDKPDTYMLADNLIVELTPQSTLASVWITSIEDDRAARAMAAWRKQLKEDSPTDKDDYPYTRIEVKRNRQ